MRMMGSFTPAIASIWAMSKPAAMEISSGFFSARRPCSGTRQDARTLGLTARKMRSHSFTRVSLSVCWISNSLAKAFALSEKSAMAMSVVELDKARTKLEPILPQPIKPYFIVTSLSDVSVSVDNVLIGGQFPQTHGATGMKFLRRDAHFAA